MSTYYVDPAASGANDGSSWTDAWTDLQSAVDNVAAGDIVYCRGTQNLSARIDWDGTSGTTSNPIRFIGCNASGVVDGTQFICNASGSADYGWYINGQDYVILDNFEVKSAPSHGVYCYTDVSSSFSFNNCSFNNNGGHGFYSYVYGQNFLFVRCAFHTNTSAGLYLQSVLGRVLFCHAYDNGSHGFYGNASQNSLYFGCISDNNGGYGYYHLGSIRNTIINCVGDNNVNGLYHNSHGGLVIGNRLTNHNDGSSVGVEAGGLTQFIGWNYLENNDTNYNNAGAVEYLKVDGTDSNDADQSDTNQGYTSATDYNLNADATLRRTAISIPD